ncbi:hypothetical protein ACFT7U_36140 [Streptomyces rochei]|uniref:hypothetical protein n=1 Tax=Streptomyces rochei TaxID=1928 RepID=UPI00363D93FD
MNSRLDFVVGQVPKRPITWTVRDELGINSLALTDYTGAQVLIFGPDGSLKTTVAATITDSPNGLVLMNWPEVSPFDTAGDYYIQLKLTNGSAADYTTGHKASAKGLGV